MTPASDDTPTFQSAGLQPERAGGAGTALVRLRNGFTITSRRSSEGDEHHLVTAPKHGPDRARARDAIMAVFEHATRVHHRVAFRVTLGDYTQQALKPRGGYDADHLLIVCGTERDPFAWLQWQLRYTSSTTTDTNAIIGVNIHTWSPKRNPGIIHPPQSPVPLPS